MVHQISVFLENRAGQLAEITELLAKNNIDLRAISIAETSDYGILRMIVDDAEKTTNILLQGGYILSMTPVLVIAVPDQPGGLVPVLSTLATFREEYIEHIVDKKCRAGICTALRRYKIDPEKCKGCGKCAKNCPVSAISGKIKSPYTIDTDKCIKCGACQDGCAFDAIYVEA